MFTIVLVEGLSQLGKLIELQGLLKRWGVTYIVHPYLRNMINTVGLAVRTSPWAKRLLLQKHKDLSSGP